MPATTPEALARKKQRRRERKGHARVEIQKSDLPQYKITARRMRPRLPDSTTKAQLREMLAEAAANTAKING
jgi:hypothetical protein